LLWACTPANLHYADAVGNDIVRQLREDSIADVMFQALLQFASRDSGYSMDVQHSAFEGLGQ